MTKNILRHHKGLKSRQIMHPIREWVIGLLFSLVIFTFFTAWSTQVYLEYREISVETSSDYSDEVILYREPMVKEAIEIFEEKENNLNDILGVESAFENNLELEAVEEDEEVASSAEVVSETASTTEGVSEEVGGVIEIVATTTEESATVESGNRVPEAPQ